MKKTGFKKALSILLCAAMIFSMMGTVFAAEKSFVDVKPGAWYYDAVMDVVDKGLFNGVGDGTSFAPDMNLSRSMFVTVLWRNEGSPEGAKNVFTDVEMSSWYGKGVAWANQAEIVKGIGNNQFGPDISVTREQMATFMFRYAKWLGCDNGERDSLAGYSDRAKVSDFAKEPVQWAMALGLLYCDSTNIRPTDAATRAEAAYILSKFLEYTSYRWVEKSAYTLAVKNGFSGTLQQWLDSLVGEDGKDGKDGKDGTNGKDGANGKSAYEIAVANGYKGTVQQWLNSLVGKTGATGATGATGSSGKSAYEIAVAEGYRGTEAEWILSLKGATGATGATGAAGKSAYEIAVAGGYEGTEEQWLASLKGETGATGATGAAGKSAYEIALAGGFEGTEEQWLISLKGEAGAAGKSAYEIAVDNGYEGSVQSWLDSLAGSGTGTNGKSAYEIAVDNGYKGTEVEWLRSLAGTNGKSAFEIAQDKGYEGTEEQWLASLVGENGKDGAAGKSAYELAVENGYKDTEEAWLASLIGPSGAPGAAGAAGKSAYELAVDQGYKGDLTSWLKTLVGETGQTGATGKSAYELAVDEGFEGDLTQWLTSLVGAPGSAGAAGKSAYELAKEDGYDGTLQDWLQSLVGDSGAAGKSAYELAVDKGYKGTEDQWLASLKGTDGAPGSAGAAGKSAYEIAVDNGFEGDEEDWLESLKGTDGAPGAAGTDGKSAYEIAVDKGFEGDEEAWLESLKGADGTPGSAGAAGVGIQNAYVNGELHLILELTNGTSIDAGYVGVSVGDITENFTVTFVDHDGTVLKSQNVKAGESAEAPENPTREGYTFTGWDKSFENVTGDLTITAVYKDNTVTTYTVLFVDHDGSTLDKQEVVAGEDAVLPDNPTRSGYYFTGWDNSWKEITAERTIQAQYVAVDGKNIFLTSSASAAAGEEVTISVELTGTVQVCGYALDLQFDTSALEFVSCDSAISMDVLVGTTGAANGVLKLNYSSAQDRTKDGGVVEITFRVKDGATGASEISLSSTSSSVICIDPADSNEFVSVEHTLCKGYVRVS